MRPKDLDLFVVGADVNAGINYTGVLSIRIVTINLSYNYPTYSTFQF